MRSGIRNVHPLKGNVDRSKGDRIDIGGTGLAVLGRAPLLGYVTFDESDTASQFPLSPDLVISQKFERFFLYHPYVESGTFRFAILQGDDWVQPLGSAEPLRMAGGATLAQVAGQKWGVQLRNLSTVVNTQGLRLCGVERITISAPIPGAGVSTGLFRVVRVDSTDPNAALTTIGFGVPRDTRLPSTIGSGLPTQASIEGTNNLAAFSINTPSKLFQFDLTRNPVLEFDVDYILTPGSALRVEGVDTALQFTPSVSFDWTERPFN